MYLADQLLALVGLDIWVLDPVLHDGEPEFALSQKGSASRLYFLFSNTAAAKKSLRFDRGPIVTQVDYFTKRYIRCPRDDLRTTSVQLSMEDYAEALRNLPKRDTVMHLAEYVLPLTISK